MVALVGLRLAAQLSLEALNRAEARRNRASCPEPLVLSSEVARALGMYHIVAPSAASPHPTARFRGFRQRADGQLLDAAETAAPAVTLRLFCWHDAPASAVDYVVTPAVSLSTRGRSSWGRATDTPPP